MLDFMKQEIITVFGGSGFIGSSVVMRLARAGYRIRVPVRDTDNANHLRVYGDVGQVVPIRCYLNDNAAMQDVIKGSHAVINLLGILFESGQSTFQSLHVEAAKTIATICAKDTIATLVHVSALGTDSKSDSQYAKSKAQGEKAVLKAFPDATILRPSVVFGPGDHFLNKFAKLASVLPVMAAFEKGATKLQPVFVGDVADAIVTAVQDAKTKGKIYELGGPEIYTLKELMTFASKTSGRARPIFDIPSPIGKVMAYIFGLFPNPLITPDQLKLLKVDNVVDKKSKGLKDLGIEPSHMEAIAPNYLKCYQKQF